MQVLYGGAVLTQEEKDRFLAAYGSEEIEARYRSLAPHFHWRMAVYCHWKAYRGARDYAEAAELEISALGPMR
jgi:hypothetical protein